MRLGTKAAILLAAIFLTLIGFNAATPSSAVELIKVGKQAGYDFIANVLEKAETTAHRVAIKE